MTSDSYHHFKYHSPVEWIQEEIKTHLTKFLGQIEKDVRRDDFRVGYEARYITLYHFTANNSIILYQQPRFGRQYQMLQEGSENQNACCWKDYKPNLREHKKKQFHAQ